MAIVYFPKPKGVRSPDRPAGSLLLAQVKHLREAEKSLPPKYHSGIFSHAVETEDEAARYVRAVTEAIHDAHDDAAAARARKAAKRKKVVEMAAMADETAGGKKRSKKAKNTRAKKGRRR